MTDTTDDAVTLESLREWLVNRRNRLAALNNPAHNPHILELNIILKAIDEGRLPRE